MAVLDDIRDGKGLKPITFNCFTCQNDNCIASGAKTATYQCPGYKHKKTNADRIREMDDVALSEFLCAIVSPPNKAVNCNICLAQDYCRMGHTGFLSWLKEEVESNDS